MHRSLERDYVNQMRELLLGPYFMSLLGLSLVSLVGLSDCGGLCCRPPNLKINSATNSFSTQPNRMTPKVMAGSPPSPLQGGNVCVELHSGWLAASPDPRSLWTTATPQRQPKHLVQCESLSSQSLRWPILLGGDNPFIQPLFGRSFDIYSINIFWAPKKSKVKTKRRQVPNSKEHQTKKTVCARTWDKNSLEGTPKQETNMWDLLRKSEV